MNKKELLKKIKSNSNEFDLQSCSFPPNVIDKLLDILIKTRRIDKFVIKDFQIFNKIYEGCVIDGNSEKELSAYFKLINIYIQINKNFDNAIIDTSPPLIINAYNLFDDKKKAIQFLLSIIDSINKFGINNYYDRQYYLSNINQYLLLSRKYYNDEIIYLSRVISQLVNLRQSSSINDLIKHDKKMAGIYDVDEEKINELEAKIVELKSKLESIEESANQNIDTYNKIDEKAQTLLNSISKFQIGDTKRVFKVMGLNEKIEQQRLLNLVKKYNENFKFHITNTSWFCKDVIDKLGVEYIANSQFHIQASIWRAYDNKQIDILKQILKIDNSFIVYYPIILNKEIIELFGVSTIANTFNNENLQELICKLYEKNEISFLKQLLNVNPNFKFNNYLKWFNKDVIDIFGIEFIAKNFNIDIQKFISWNFSHDSYPLLKKINDINSKFIINPLLSKLPNDIIERIQNVEYLANIDVNKIKVIEYFDRCYKMRKLNYILMTKTDFTINNYITENEEENIIDEKEAIINDIINKLHPDEIVKMFENDSINYKKLYNCIVLIANTTNFKCTFKSLFYEMPEEYKDQVLSIDFIDQDDITKLDSSQQKIILRNLNAILRNYKIKKNIKKLIKKPGKK